MKTLSIVVLIVIRSTVVAVAPAAPPLRTIRTHSAAAHAVVSWQPASFSTQGQRHQPSGTFGRDLAVLREHTDVVVLKDAKAESQVAVVPQYQGRVMTSTADGDDGLSFGWMNRKLIASGTRQKHINAFGGEDRLWFGPEGGQFSIFFAPGQPFDFEHWQTPESIDLDRWPTISVSRDRVRFRRTMTFVNWSKTKLELTADREVRLLSRSRIAELLRVPVDKAVKVVAYETDNRITNTGDRAWTKQTGSLSIWILGMFNPSDATTVVIPFKPGPQDVLGPIVNDAYFGKIPSDRLRVQAKDGLIYFRGDGTYRSKIGVSPNRAKPMIGSYDAEAAVLTLVQYTVPKDATTYVNSMWQLQDDPFDGDLVNSYNDGPLDDGSQLGPFYELESSSPAALLKPGATMRHVRRTIHLVGPEASLDRIAQATLGVGVSQIRAAFGPQPRTGKRRT